MIRILGGIVLLLLFQIGKTDWETKTIPNKWSVLLAVIGFIYGHLIFRMPIVEQFFGMLAVSGLLLFLVFLKPGTIGGGDIKLMAASGLMLGIKANFVSFYVGLLGATVYIIIQFLRGKIRWETKFPLGPFLCAGIATVFVYASLIR